MPESASADPNPAPAENAHRLGSRIAELESVLRGACQARHEAEEASEAAAFEQKSVHDKAAKELQEKRKAALEALEREGERGRARVAARAKHRAARVERAHAGMRARLIREQKALSDRCRHELQSRQDAIMAEEKLKSEELAERHDAAVADIGALREKAKALQARIEGLAGALGAPAEPEGAEADVRADERSDTREFLDATAGKMAETNLAYRRLQYGLWPSLGRRAWMLTAFVIVAAAHAGGLWLIQQSPKRGVYLMALFASSLVSTLFVYFLTGAMRERATRAVNGLLATVKESIARLHKQEELEKSRFWAASKELMERRVAQMLSVEEKIGTESGGKKTALEVAFAELGQRHHALKEKAQASAQRDRERFERAHEDERARLTAEHDAAAAEALRKRQAARDKAEAAKRESVARATEAWNGGLGGIKRFAKEAEAASLKRQPAWVDLDAAPNLGAPAFPPDIRVGMLELPFQRLDVPGVAELQLPAESIAVPLALSLPGCGSMLVQAGSARRGQAFDILFNAALRLLSSLPPGLAKLTVIDPVGLGQNFSALMQLADHDEALIGGRIWTDAGHIEKRLAELTEHMEKIIQKYLRNRFATIGEYNAKAGEMKEAYQFLLLTDFPTGISDLAVERLASIVSSGAPCGVHVLMHHDLRQKWPEAIDLAPLRRSGLILKESHDGFAVLGEGLERGRFVPESVPEPALVARMLDRIGRRAVEAKRVELAFGTVAPETAQMWSRTTEKTFKVPIGRSGAVKLQEMELGRGTAQHALIAGRTGSGKSTLFHVMVTNTALWFSPREVEFYLIDFKKGVEFKAYATHGLPHARVIAIESDRDFGLSVLKRLDRELDRRGELFRQAGVQDLPSYRRQHPAVEMPRTLLMIDEFQEFFTEDDAVSQEASLLLDRFVRQGRAFGVHVILGSQTLSGVYSLAKSTLGQMGVRIALQCNESDSYLILSEDNAAARLLSRPGEAIYNDMSGLVEGNNPFQIVWLPDDVEAGHLKSIAARHRAEGRPPVGPTVVFEGNAPARLELNEPLRQAIEHKPAGADPILRAWLGEPNAIKGPTEIGFAEAGGSHLLMIGQRKDAALGMSCSILLSLAARAAGEGNMRLIVLDGSGHEHEEANPFARLARALPQELELPGMREIPKVIEDLDREIAAGQEAGQPPDRHTFLFVFGMQRFRALRQADDFSMSSSRDEGAATGERFANILREGPEQRIHTVVWCDTLANASRAMNRRTLREFDMRVLFQISAADSSELIDSPAANTLGLHNALLFVESEGLLEKFRPYALPDEGWLDSVRGALRARASVR
ncbi:MAG: hypothetical protein HS116_28850 [Planctomycetes bacterium]|nr:hypothetical protein [Planctomycetota bacterium]